MVIEISQFAQNLRENEFPNSNFIQSGTPNDNTDDNEPIPINNQLWSIRN